MPLLEPEKASHSSLPWEGRRWLRVGVMMARFVPFGEDLAGFVS